MVFRYILDVPTRSIIEFVHCNYPVSLHLAIQFLHLTKWISLDDVQCMPVHTKSLYYLEYQVHRGENEPRNKE